MTKILCLTLFGEICGSSRVRVLQFIPFLKKHGILCEKKALYPDEYFRIISNQKKVNRIIKSGYTIASAWLMIIKKIKYAFESNKYDVIIVQKDVFPRWLQKIMKRKKVKIIFEFDDTIFEPSQTAKGINRIYDSYRRKALPSFLQTCSHIIAENNYLANYARKYNSNVSIISAPIDTDEFCPVKKKEKKALVLGWIGSSFTTNQLQLLTNVMESIGKKYPLITLKLIGADNSVEFKGIKVKKVKWSLDTVVKEIQSFDIGLMPLDENPFNKGRLGYKMIQYMSIGIPTVASNTGLNPEIIKENLNGFLASNDNEWIDKLSSLIENGKLREDLGKKSREFAVNIYSLKKAQPSFLEIINKVIKKGSG